MSWGNKYNRSPEETEAIYRKIVAEQSVGQFSKLSGLRREVQVLLSRAVSLTPVTVEQMAMVEHSIAQRPYLQQQLADVYRADGASTVERLFDHPVVQIASPTLQEWFDNA